MGRCLCILITIFSISVTSLSFAQYTSAILPRLTVAEQYTDNVFLTRDNKESDWISLISPGIVYDLKGRHEELSLEYVPTFTYYHKLDEFETRHDATLRGRRQFSKALSFEISDTFLRTDEPYLVIEPVFTRTQQPPPLGDPTIRQTRSSYYNNLVNARLQYDFGERDLVYVNYLNEILRNSDPNVENNSRHEPSIGLTYWFNPQYGLETSAIYTRGDFSLETEALNEWFASGRVLRRFTPHLDGFIQYAHTYIDVVGTNEDYQVYDATIGVDYSITRTTFLSFSTGYFYQNPNMGDAQSGYILRGDMAKQFRRGSVRLSGGTGYRQTFFGAENLGFTKVHEVSLAGVYSFSRRINGELLLNYWHNEYPDISDRKDNIFTFDFGLTYALKPWLLANVHFTRHSVDSTLRDDTYDENRITLGITIVPPRPVRFH